MRNIRIASAAVFLAVLSALAFLASGCGEKPALLRIYFTTDVRGNLTPCG